MLIYDLNIIGNTLYKIRKSKGLTQADVAEKAELSDRTYADIERGSVTMRIDTLLKICGALCITPNDVLVAECETVVTQQDILEAIKDCSALEKETVLNLINVYISSIR